MCNVFSHSKTRLIDLKQFWEKSTGAASYDYRSIYVQFIYIYFKEIVIWRHAHA